MPHLLIGFLVGFFTTGIIRFLIKAQRNRRASIEMQTLAKELDNITIR